MKGRLHREWVENFKLQIQQLQKLQNRAAKIITDSNYNAPRKPLIEALGCKNN